MAIANLKDRLAQAVEAGGQPNAELDPVFGGTAPPLPRGKVRQSVMLPIDRLDPWSDKDHSKQPFRLYGPREKQDMMDSLSAHGLHMPIIVRPFNGRYQILAGHNRVICAQAIGWTEIEAFVENGLSDADAAERMVSTNFNQRPYLLPSERAKGYKILLDNLSHQGKQDGATGQRSDAQVGEGEGVGRSTIQRYVRLTRLSDDMLELVDGFQWDPQNPEQWDLFPKKPIVPLTAADKLVDLSVADQAYLVSLVKARRIAGISPAQAGELKSVRDSTPKGEDLPENLINRCLGLDINPEPKEQPPIVIKLPVNLFRSVTPDAAKYMSDPELQSRIAMTIEDFIETRAGGGG